MTARTANGGRRGVNVPGDRLTSPEAAKVGFGPPARQVETRFSPVPVAPRNDVPFGTKLDAERRQKAVFIC
jgi:hypothetical protein